jgi:hypothetical protein
MLWFSLDLILAQPDHAFWKWLHACVCTEDVGFMRLASRALAVSSLRGTPQYLRPQSAETACSYNDVIKHRCMHIMPGCTDHIDVLTVQYVCHLRGLTKTAKPQL